MATVKESLKVINVSKGPISFYVQNPIPLGNVAQSSYHRRKIRRLGMQHVLLPPNMLVDLVEQTGMTVKELKDDFEMKKILMLDGHRFRIVYDSEIMTPPGGFYPVYF